MNRRSHSNEFKTDTVRQVARDLGINEGILHKWVNQFGKRPDGSRVTPDEHGMLCSMSRKGDCWDNAVAESFFSTLKIERVRHRLYRSRDEAKRDIFEYIEVFYNRVRLHSTLGQRPPLPKAVTPCRGALRKRRDCNSMTGPKNVGRPAS